MEVRRLLQVRTGTHEIRADAAVNRCETLLACFPNHVYSVVTTFYPFTCVDTDTRDCMHRHVTALQCQPACAAWPIL